MIGLYSANSQSALGFTGLLDEYGGAAAAYSVRRLSSTYTGALIEVRRSSDNTTQDIGYDVNGDLDTAALLSFVGAGDGFVRTWYDQSGNANNAQQTTTSLQPQIVSSGVVITTLSKPSLSMATNGSFNFSASTLINNNPSTVFDVIDFTGDSGSYIYFQGQTLGYYFQGTSNIQGNVGTPSYYANGSLATLSNTPTVQLVSITDIDLSSWTQFNFGGYNFATYYFTGRSSEVIIYGNDQSFNRAGIESNINGYYSIY